LLHVFGTAANEQLPAVRRSARKFVEHWHRPDLKPTFNMEGVILQTVAPPEAVLLIRQPEDYYDEGEVIAATAVRYSSPIAGRIAAAPRRLMP
jgi:hypothetical protein